MAQELLQELGRRGEDLTEIIMLRRIGRVGVNEDMSDKVATLVKVNHPCALTTEEGLDILLLPGYLR